MALARRGDGERAAKMLRLLNPIEHTGNPETAWRYGVEPYVIAADVYRLTGRIGQGGWSWQGFNLRYRHGEAIYEIQVENPEGRQCGVSWVEMDGRRLPDKVIPLERALVKHRILVHMGGI